MDLTFLLIFLLVCFLIVLLKILQLKKNKVDLFSYTFLDAQTQNRYNKDAIIISVIGERLKSIGTSELNQKSLLAELNLAINKIDQIPLSFTKMHADKLAELSKLSNYASSLIELMQRPDRIGSEEALVNTLPALKDFGNSCIALIVNLNMKLQEHSYNGSAKATPNYSKF